MVSGTGVARGHQLFLTDTFCYLFFYFGWGNFFLSAGVGAESHFGTFHSLKVFRLSKDDSTGHSEKKGKR